MIERVQCLHLQAEPEAFRNRNAFRQRQVVVHEVWAIQVDGSRNGAGRSVWRYVSRIGAPAAVEVLGINEVNRRLGRQVVNTHGALQLRYGNAVQDDAAVTVVVESVESALQLERTAGLECENAAEGPAAYNSIQR